MDIITTAQAGKVLGVSTRRIQAMIKSGLIKATPFGEGERKYWIIRESDLVGVKTYGVSGRPRKQ